MILLAQLLLSIVLADGAYQISACRRSRRELLPRRSRPTRSSSTCSKSPQNLAASAEALGMVMSTAPAVYLRLSDGAVIGTPTAMQASQAAVIGADGALVANSLLDGCRVIDAGCHGGSRRCRGELRRTGRARLPRRPTARLGSVDSGGIAVTGDPLDRPASPAAHGGMST